MARFLEKYYYWKSENWIQKINGHWRLRLWCWEIGIWQANLKKSDQHLWDIKVDLCWFHFLRLFETLNIPLLYASKKGLLYPEHLFFDLMYNLTVFYCGKFYAGNKSYFCGIYVFWYSDQFCFRSNFDRDFTIFTKTSRSNRYNLLFQNLS